MQVTDERHFDIREALRCFEPYLEANRRTKNPVFHASLNPAPEDRLSNDELRQIAREYMERMGYGAQPCFVFLHEDIERRHIHIVSLRVGLDGRKLAHDFEARRSRESSMLWNDATVCALPPRATRSRRTTRCRNSTIRKATSNDKSHRSCA